jgi:hypothetical protein
VVVVAGLVVLLAVPAAALRLSCAWNSCAAVAGTGATKVPFCSLPVDMKTLIAAGFREGRSPDVLGVTGRWTVTGGTAGGQDPTASVPWASTDSVAATRVPIVFSGAGVDDRSAIGGGAELDQIAPTVSAAIGFQVPHPEVRKGTAFPGVAGGETPRLVLEVAWKGIGSDDLSSAPDMWPALHRLLHDGVGTMDAHTGSLPVDPAATLTTIGTGGLPSEHGMTGRLVRNDSNDVVSTWGEDSPPSVIATLPDDYDYGNGERPLIGLVATADADRGIIGKHWYPDDDRDPTVIDPDPRAQVTAVTAMLRRGFGRDDVPDILALVARGAPARLDAQLRSVVTLAERASNGSLLVVVTGTGSVQPPASAGETTAAAVVRQVDDAAGVGDSLVEASVPGGLFLDQAVLTQAGVTGQVAQRALAGAVAPDGSSLMSDTFQGFFVSFGKYC